MAKQFNVDTGGTLTTSLAAYYKLSDLTDFYSTNDLTNTGSCTFAAGKIGNAVDSGASPSGKYLSIGSNLGTTGNNVSISGWGKMRITLPTDSQQNLFNVSNSTHSNDYRVVYGNSGGTERVGFARQRAGIAEDFAYSNQTIGTTWHHVVITYDGTTLEGWFDGTKVVSVARSGDGSGGPNTFGILKNTVDNIYQMEGLVDEVGVWTKKLSDTEVADLYNSGSGNTMDDILTLSVNDSITVTESTSLTQENNISVNDAITVSESVSLIFPLDVSVSDSITVTESVTMDEANLGDVSVNDAISVAEAVTMDNLSLGDISVFETVTLTEFVSIDSPMDISVSDSIAVSESVEINEDLNPSVYDAITVTESISLAIPAQKRGVIVMRSTQQKYPIAMDDSRVL